MARDEQPSGDEWRLSMAQPPPSGWTMSASNIGPLAGESDQSHPFAERYVADAKLGVANARASYRRLMRIFWTLRFGVIGSGLLVAVLSAAGTPIWTIATFGALAAAFEAVMLATNLQNRAVVRGLYADAVAKELRTFELRIEPYASDDRVAVLHGRLEGLRESASGAQFKLDQAAGSSD
jgi:hypothetical protein